jgi:hypothetical protein
MMVVLLSLFNISNLSNKFNIVIVIASVHLPAYKFAKKFERVPSMKEKLIFGFCTAIGSETIGLIVILPFYRST